MATTKSKDDVKLSAELTNAVNALVSKAEKTGGSLSEDDVQIAIKDIDIDGDELSDLYDAVRAKGVDIISMGEDEPVDEDLDVDDDFGPEDEDEDEDDEDESMSEAKEIREALQIGRAHV